MSFIQMSGSFSDVQEKRPVAKGIYNLRIDEAVDHTSKSSGKPSIKCTISIDGHDDAPKIMHYVPIPNADDDEQRVVNKMLMIKRFLTTFSIPFEDNGFALEDFYGATAQCEVILTDPDEEGANGNVSNKLNLPRLKDEEVMAPGKKAAKR